MNRVYQLYVEPASFDYRASDDVVDAVDPAARDALHVAIDGLPEDEQTVINGLFWEQLSQREIAVRYAIPRDKVARLYAAAVATLSDAELGSRASE